MLPSPARAPLTVVLALVMALAVACGPSDVHRVINPPTVGPPPSPAPGRATLTVQVNTLGACVGYRDTFEIRGKGANVKSAPLLGTADPSSFQVITNVNGVIPCTFQFYVPNVKPSPLYFIVDETTHTGWGPWSLDGMQRSNWVVSVDITDMH